MESIENSKIINPHDVGALVDQLISPNVDKETLQNCLRKLGEFAVEASDTEADTLQFVKLLEAAHSGPPSSESSSLITELELALKTLEVENFRLNGFLEGSNAGTWEWDANTGIETFDKRCAAMAGYTLEEIEPHAEDFWDKITHPEDLKRSKELLRKCMDGETDYYVAELWTIHKDGHSICIEDRGKVFERDENNKAVRLLGTSVDITERKKAEEALRSSQQIIERIINTIPVRVFWKDKNLVYLGCNNIFASDAGLLKPEDIIGKNDFQLSWRDQAELYRENDRQVIESGNPKYQVEEPQTTPDGRESTLLTSKIPLLDANGEISGLLGTYMDITERKEAENDLRESEERYRSLFENMVEGVVLHKMLYDASGKAIDYIIEDVNPAYESILGVKAKDVIGKKASEIYGTGKPPFIDTYAKISAGGQPERFNVEFAPMHKWFSISASFISKEYFTSVFEDITEREHHIEELEQLSKRDPLTNLLNKGELKKELEKLLSQVEYDSASAFAMFDIVGFGEFNIKHSHALGDATLKEFAKSLSESIRQSDSTLDEDPRDSDVAAKMSGNSTDNIPLRFGGDEFVAIFKGIKNNKLDLKAFATEKSKRILLGLKSYMLANGLNEFGVHANIVWVDSAKYDSYDKVLIAVDPKYKPEQDKGIIRQSRLKKLAKYISTKKIVSSEPSSNKIEIVMQLDKNGDHFFYDNVRRTYIDN